MILRTKLKTDLKVRTKTARVIVTIHVDDLCWVSQNAGSGFGKLWRAMNPKNTMKPAFFAS